MTKKFVVALHAAPHLRDVITMHFSGRGWRYWHWYSDLWLLSEVPGHLTPYAIYEEIERVIPTLVSSSLLVLEMGPELRYYGRAPVQEAWDWMRQYWGAPDLPVPADQVKQSIAAPDGTK